MEKKSLKVEITVKISDADHWYDDNEVIRKLTAQADLDPVIIAAAQVILKELGSQLKGAIQERRKALAEEARQKAEDEARMEAENAEVSETV
jgi:hypothetical protein